jgi:hypothetical protein
MIKAGFLILALLASSPAWAEETTAADVEKVLNDVAIASPQEAQLGVGTWFVRTPDAKWNTAYQFSLFSPIGNTPWNVVTDFVPVLGTGHLSTAYQIPVGPVVLYPALGFRFFGAASPPDGMMIGPYMHIGAAVPITSWLGASATVAYSPYLAVVNTGGAGSEFDYAFSLVGSYDRFSLALGYTGLVVNGKQAGGGAFSGDALGGPTVGVFTRF